MSKKKPNIKYVGEIPCKIPSTDIGVINPNQSLSLPQSMVDNLVLDKNWERVESDETPTPPATKKEKKESKEAKDKGGK